MKYHTFECEYEDNQDSGNSIRVLMGDFASVLLGLHEDEGSDCKYEIKVSKDGQRFYAVLVYPNSRECDDADAVVEPVFDYLRNEMQDYAKNPSRSMDYLAANMQNGIERILGIVSSGSEGRRKARHFRCEPTFLVMAGNSERVFLGKYGEAVFLHSDKHGMIHDLMYEYQAQGRVVCPKDKQSRLWKNQYMYLETKVIPDNIFAMVEVPQISPQSENAIRRYLSYIDAYGRYDSVEGKRILMRFLEGLGDSGDLVVGYVKEKTNQQMVFKSVNTVQPGLNSHTKRQTLPRNRAQQNDSGASYFGGTTSPDMQRKSAPSVSGRIQREKLKKKAESLQIEQRKLQQELDILQQTQKNIEQQIANLDNDYKIFLEQIEKQKEYIASKEKQQGQQ